MCYLIIQYVVLALCLAHKNSTVSLKMLEKKKLKNVIKCNDFATNIHAIRRIIKSMIICVMSYETDGSLVA